MTNNIFIPKISPRNIQRKNKLAIITSFYNPCNYINIRYNYLEFKKHIKKYGTLFPIELSLGKKFFINDENVIQIQGSEKNILWQKEALLNIALDNLPEEYTDVAWIDCDVIFENPYWVELLFEALNNYKIIQLYKYANQIGKTGNLSKRISVYSDYVDGIPGYAWAGRREVLDEIKFLDTMILGGADSVMAYTFMNKLDYLNRIKVKYTNITTTNEWINKAVGVVDQSVTNIDNSILHLYHGSVPNRNYFHRYEHHLRDFDIDSHILKNEKHIWQIDDKKISESISCYFQNRNEDDNLIDLNTYFDKIYLINLDRDVEKLEKTSEKLKRYNIKYERFPAIDGSVLIHSLNYENHNIENQYKANILACRLSHLEIIKQAKKNKYKKILILEDDIKFCENFEIYLQHLRNIDDWKLLYLGASQHLWKDIKYIDNFYYCGYTVGAFAYGIDSSLYDIILEYSERHINMPIDNICTFIQKEFYGLCYVAYPNLIIANVEESSLRPARDQELHSHTVRWDMLEYR